MKKNSFQILKYIHTDYQLHSFINQLYKIKKSLFITNENYLNNPDIYLSQEQQEWLSLSIANKTDMGQSSSFQLEIDKLIANLLKTPKINITLNKYYSANFLKRIAVRIRVETGKPLVISLNIDESIIGGIIIHYQGEYYDYSLRNRIDQLISNRQLSIE